MKLITLTLALLLGSLVGCSGNEYDNMSIPELAERTIVCIEEMRNCDWMEDLTSEQSMLLNMMLTMLDQDMLEAVMKMAEKTGPTGLQGARDELAKMEAAMREGTLCEDLKKEFDEATSQIEADKETP